MTTRTWVVQYDDGGQWADTDYGVCETLEAARKHREWYVDNVPGATSTRIIQRATTETVVES